MNKAFLASVLIAMSVTVPAMAADMPLKAPIYAPPIVYNWTGCYIGANAGYARGHSDVNYAQTGAYSTYPPAYVAFADSLGSPKIAMSGFTGGGQIGCNYQAGSFVFAIEGDGEYVGLSGTAAALAIVPVFLSMNSSSASVSSHSLFTVRPRAGYAVDRTLFYVTGGYAAGNVSYSETYLHLRSNSVEAGAVSATRSGWTVGGGVEYAMTKNWTVKGEYLYVDLGPLGFATGNNLFPTFTSVNSAALKENIIRFGLNYKF